MSRISDAVSIRAHTVIGAGVVILADVPDHVVAYGGPARVPRDRVEGRAVSSALITAG